jgi:phage gp29-like protein
MDSRLRTLGYDGSKIWSGQLDRQEWHRDLQDPFTKQKIYREMLENQPEIARGTRDVSDQLKTGKWPIRPPKGMGKNKRAKETADWLQAALEGMTTPWTDVLEDCLSGIPFGYNLSEITWKNQDGMWLPDRIERRPQWTAYGWLKDTEGRVVAFRQRDPQTGALVDIPLEYKALHLTFGA